MSNCHWRDANHAAQRAAPVSEWKSVVTRVFRPSVLLLSSGSWSDPALCPSDGIIVVNSGALEDHGYDVVWWQYAACAMTAGFCFVLNLSPPVDLLVYLDAESVLGEINAASLVSEFTRRPEELMSPAWHSGVDGTLSFWKRRALSRFVHQRRRANLVEPNSTSPPELIENELAWIFRGRWWNPWPSIDSVRQDYGFPGQRKDSDVANLPLVGGPSPSTRSAFKSKSQVPI